VPFSAAGGSNTLHAFLCLGRYHASCGDLSSVCDQLKMLKVLTATALVPYLKAIRSHQDGLLKSSEMCPRGHALELGVTQDHDQTNNCLRSQWQVTIFWSILTEESGAGVVVNRMMLVNRLEWSQRKITVSAEESTNVFCWRVSRVCMCHQISADAYYTSCICDSAVHVFQAISLSRNISSTCNVSVPGWNASHKSRHEAMVLLHLSALR
jgi:hypothetical protein